MDIMQIDFTGRVIFWKGPAPFFFVAVPTPESSDIQAIANHVSYGWGVIPVHVRIGKTEFETSLFPKDGRYLVPIKTSVREAEQIDEGDEVLVELNVRNRG